MSQQQHIYVLATPQGEMWSSTTPSPCVSSSIWTTHRATNDSTSRFHLKAFAPSYPFQHVFQHDIWRPLCLNFIMFWLRGRRLVYNSTNIPILSIIFPNFLHITMYATWITPSLNCKHLSMCMHTSHWPYGYPPLTLCSWQQTHWNPWCYSWHLCHHCMRCWFPRGMRTITCASFNHIQFLLSTSQHCAYQNGHSHFSQCCHCWPNTNGFTSPILRNSRICCLRCSSSQGKELLQTTPHWSIPSFNNWGIWFLTQTCWYAFTRLCQCHLELKGEKKLSSF